MIEPILDAIKANSDPSLYPFILLGMMGGTILAIFGLMHMMAKITMEEAKA